MKGVVYKYTNKLNGRVYIGQTLNEAKRREKWREINSDYAGRCINLMRKRYGINAFEYSVIEEVEGVSKSEIRRKLEQLEIKYIIQHKAYNPQYGYNRTGGGKNGRGQIFSAQARRNMSEAQKGLKKPMSEQGKLNISLAHRGARPYIYKKVAQYDKEGNLIKVWNSLTEVVRAFGDKNQGNLIASMKGKYRKKYYKGFKWDYYGIVA